MKKVLAVFRWFSITTFALMAMGVFSNGAWFAAIIIAALIALAVPRVFEKVSEPWKKYLEERYGQGKGELSRPFVSLLLSWAIVILTIGVAAPPSQDAEEKKDEPQPVVEAPINVPDHIKSYVVVKTKDTSFATRRRRSYYIVADEPMASLNDYLVTGIKAAKEIAAGSKAEVITVFFELDVRTIERGNPMAIINHYTDGMGNSGEDETGKWDISVSSTLPTPRQFDFMIKTAEISGSKELSDQDAERKMIDLIDSIENADIWLPDRDNVDVSDELVEQVLVSTGNVKEIKRAEAAMCLQSRKCISDEYQSRGAAACENAIENQARYDYEWMDNWMIRGAMVFKDIRLDLDKKLMYFMGDRVKFKNGFGVFQRMEYICLYDLKTKSVDRVEMGGL